MSDTQIRPAFPPKFWPIVLAELARNGNSWGAALVNTVGFKEEMRHEAAALALYGQPYGFSWQDVWNLENSGVLEIQHVAKKIAALLPPIGADYVERGR